MGNSETANKAQKPATPGKLFGKFFGITFAIAIVVATVGVTYGMHLLDAKPMDKENNPNASTEQTPEKIDILIAGEGIFATDYKDSKRVNCLLLGNTSNGLTDTIMLASFDPESKAVDIISVPRDTYYARPGFEHGAFLKINSAFHEGFIETANAVHNVLQGIPLNYYAVIDYDGIKKIVDSMDGVPMYVPMRMKYTDKSQNLYIDLQKGDQVLDGDHAVQFIRFRKGYPEGDLGRVKAQQNFVKAAIKRAIGLNLPKVAETVVDNVESDIRLRTILYLLKQSSGVSLSDVESYITPGEDKYINNLSFYVPAEDAVIEQMLREIYDGPQETTGAAVTTGGSVTGSATE